MIEKNEVKGLMEAQVELATAIAARSALDQQHAVANANLKNALTQRDTIVKSIAAGSAVNSAEIIEATDAIKRNEAHAKMLADALAEHDGASERARAKIAKILEREGYKKLATAIEARLSLTKKADAMGAEMLAWLSEMQANGVDIDTAWGEAKCDGLMPEFHKGDMRFASAFVPYPFQNSIVKTGSVVTYSLYDCSRVNWKNILDRANRRGGEDN